MSSLQLLSSPAHGLTATLCQQRIKKKNKICLWTNPLQFKPEEWKNHLCRKPASWPQHDHTILLGKPRSTTPAAFTKAESLQTFSLEGRSCVTLESRAAGQGNACVQPGEQVRGGSLARQLLAHIITHCTTNPSPRSLLSLAFFSSAPAKPRADRQHPTAGKLKVRSRFCEADACKPSRDCLLCTPRS